MMKAARFIGLVCAGLLFVAACGDDDDDSGSGNPSGVGNACDTNEDCQTGECYLGPGGGYCTAPCTNEGDTAACPPDTVCKPIQGGPARCLLICGSESSCGELESCDERYCPSGSSCVDVSDSNFAGCEPNPN